MHDNVRMQVIERDSDRKGTCTSCLAVKENVATGQGTEQQCCPVRETLNVSVFPTRPIGDISAEIEEVTREY